FFFSSRRRHTRWPRDWSSDVCSSDLGFSKRMTQRINEQVQAMQKLQLRLLLRRKEIPTMIELMPAIFPAQFLAPGHHSESGVRRSEERRVGIDWMCGVLGGC